MNLHYGQPLLETLQRTLARRPPQYDKVLERLIDSDTSYVKCIAKFKAKALDLKDNKKPSKNFQHHGAGMVGSVLTPTAPRAQQDARALVCNEWKSKGTCEKFTDGKKCPYAHLNKYKPKGGRERDRDKGTSRHNKTNESPKKRGEGEPSDKSAEDKKTCYSWKSSQSCARGDKCQYAHVNVVQIADVASEISDRVV